MPEKDCKSCQQKGVSLKQIGIIILGFYMIGSCMYGTVMLAEKLIGLFK